jgi:hypothetical protein
LRDEVAALNVHQRDLEFRDEIGKASASFYGMSTECSCEGAADCRIIAPADAACDAAARRCRPPLPRVT